MHAANNPKRMSADMLDVYKDIIMMSKAERPSTLNFKSIIVASGDIDPVVNLHGTEAAIEALNLVELDEVREDHGFFQAKARMVIPSEQALGLGPNLHTGDAGPQMGGFHRNFNTTTKMSFHFVTVKILAT